MKESLSRTFFQRELPGARLWVVWLLIVVAVLLVHVLTLTISPTIWQDEVTLVDLGRVILFQPHSDWSITWVTQESRPLFVISYLGPALQEFGYRITAPLFYGPRIASLLGGAVAATTTIGWLLSRRTPRSASLILGVAILLDPILVQSYRGARVDCWALALVFGSCWALRSSGARCEEGRSFTWLIVAAGSLASLAFFFWPTAVLMYPLVLAEAIVVYWREARPRSAWANLFKSLTALALGGVATTLMLLIPIREHLGTFLHDVSTFVNGNQPGPHGSLLIQSFWNGHKSSPILLALAIVGAVLRRSKWIAIAAVAVVLYSLTTQVYIWRVLYLLPYEIGLVAGACQSLPGWTLTSLRRWSYRFALFFLVLWSAGLSLVARPALALSQKQARNAELLFDASRSSLGDGDHKVYLGAWEFYFAGRSLGWRMFNPVFDSDGSRSATVLSEVDYAVFPSRDVNDDLTNRLSKAGLHLISTLALNNEKTGDGVRFNLGGASGYGPYALYGR